MAQQGMAWQRQPLLTLGIEKGLQLGKRERRRARARPRWRAARRLCCTALYQLKHAQAGGSLEAAAPPLLQPLAAVCCCARCARCDAIAGCWAMPAIGHARFWPACRAQQHAAGEEG